MKFNTRKAGTFFSAFSFAFISMTSVAQLSGENIVPNGSFESLDKKPKRLGQIEMATEWVSPTGVRADLFIDGKLEDIGTPYNIYGKESAKDGENYAGIVAYSYGDKMPRSYIMTKLTTPMKKGMTYCVKFNISLAEASKYASNNVSILIGKRIPDSQEKLPIIEKASVKHVENDYSTFSGRYGWNEVCGVYYAEGGEKYIAIGNFDSNEDTRSERMKKDPKVKDIKVDQIMSAYYYIDDVSIKLVDTERGEKCDCAIQAAGESYSAMIYQKVFTITDEMTPKEKVEKQQVYFAFGKSTLSVEGEKSLDLIAEQMKANPATKLRIMGHNNVAEDEVAAEENDLLLDMDNQRIAAVMKYLMDKGVAESRLIPTRRGASEVNTKEISDADDDEIKQAKNRRVEFELK